MSLSEKALLVAVKVSTPGTSKRDNDITDDTLSKYAASEGAGAFIKRTLNAEPMRELKSIGAAAGKYLRDNSFAWGAGFRLVGVIKDGKPFWPEFETTITEYLAKFQAAGEKVCEAYPQMIEDDKSRMGGTWKASDYPPLHKIQKSIKFGFQVSPVPDGDFRAALSEADKEKLRDRLNAEFQKQFKASVREVTLEVSEALSELAEMLADEEKVLHPNSVARIKRIATSQASMMESVFGDDLADAKKLRETLEKVAEVADAIRPETVNVNSFAREHYTGEVDKLANTMAEFF
jgi:hypothetical protein